MFLFLKENLFKIILIFILAIILAYVVNISSIPESIILFENEDFSIDMIAGIKLEETVLVGANLGTKVSTNLDNQKQYNLSLLGVNLKTITANVIENTRVVPLGNLIGIKHLIEGKSIDEIIKELENIPCKNRGTSCPDQLANALKIYRKYGMDKK